MQSTQYNLHYAIHKIQSILCNLYNIICTMYIIKSAQCNPIANLRIYTMAKIATIVIMAIMAMAIITVTKILEAIKNIITQNHYG